MKSILHLCTIFIALLANPFPSFASSYLIHSAFHTPHPAFNSAFRLPPSALLAELPSPTPAAFGQWLLSAVVALSIVVLAKQLTRKTPIEAEFLTKREFNEFKGKDFADLRHRLDHSFQSLSDKLDHINERISEVRALVDRVDERTKHLPLSKPNRKS